MAINYLELERAALIESKTNHQQSLKRIIKSWDIGKAPTKQYNRLLFVNLSQAEVIVLLEKMIKSEKSEKLGVLLNNLYGYILELDKYKKFLEQEFIVYLQNIVVEYAFSVRIINMYNFAKALKIILANDVLEEKMIMVYEKFTDYIINFESQYKFSEDFDRLLRREGINIIINIAPSAFLDVFMPKYNSVVTLRDKSYFNFLDFISEDEIIKWCENNKDYNLSIAEGICPVKKDQWSKLAIYLVDNAVDKIKLLDMFYDSLSSRKFHGDELDFFKNNLVLLKYWQTYTSLEILSWVNEKEIYYTKKIRELEKVKNYFEY